MGAASPLHCRCLRGSQIPRKADVTVEGGEGGLNARKYAILRDIRSEQRRVRIRQESGRGSCRD
jgi:hypothetical protein